MYVNLSQSTTAFSELRGQRNVRARIDDNLGRLATGYKIRSASDGPASLVAGEFLRGRVRSLEQANENLQSGSNMLGVAEGALTEVSGLLVKLRGLSTEAANFVDPDLIEALQREAESIVEAIDRIGETTRSHGTELFNGDFQRTVTIQPLSSINNVGAVAASVPDFSTLSLGFHQLTVRAAGGTVTRVDTSAATVGIGEEGQVTDPGEHFVGAPPLMTDSFAVYQRGGADDWVVQDITGLDATITPLTAGFANITDLVIGPDSNSVLFEADNGANRGVFRVTFAGVITQLGFGFDDSDFDVSDAIAPSDHLAFVAPVQPFSILPNIDDVDGLAFNPTSSEILVADNNGGAPFVQRYTTAGVAVGGTIALPGATEVLGFDHAGVGNDFFVLDRSGGGVFTVRRYTIAGGIAVENVPARITLPGVSFGATNIDTFMGNNGGNEAIGEAVIPLAVNDASEVRFQETITISFTEDAGAAGLADGVLPITVTGSVSGAIFAGTYNIYGGLIDIPPLGISVDLEALHGATRGTAGAVTALGGAVNRVGVNVDGLGVHPDNFGGPFATGAAIAAGIEFQVNSTAPGGTIQAVFDPGAGGPADGDERYILQSDTVGAASSVVTSAGFPGAQDRQDDLRLRAADGAVRGLGADIITGDFYTFDIASTGSSYRGLTFDGANLRIGDSDTGVIYSFTTAGVQNAEQIDFTSLGLGSIERLEFDPTAAAATGSFFVLTNTGNVVEIDDQPTIPGGVIPLFRNNFAQSGTELGIAADGAGNLFIGSDSLQEVRQISNTGAGLAGAIFHEDLGTLVINQVAASGSDPHLSINSARIAYITGGTFIETRNTAGGALISRNIGAAVTSIEDVSLDGRFVSYRSGGAGFVIDMNTGAITATGDGQEFSPAASNDLFYVDGAGSIFRLTVDTGILTQLTNVFGNPASTSDFDVSPDGSRVAYQTLAGELRTLNAVVGTNLTDPPASPNPVGGSGISFSPNSLLVTFAGADGEVWVRNRDGTNIPVVPAGGAFSAGPVVLAANTVLDETFTITCITDNDGADVFSVTGSLSGFQGNATAGVAFVTPGGIGGQGAGLSFTIRVGGQYALGTSFEIDTAFLYGASLDGGPEVVGVSQESEIAFSPSGESIQLDFGSVQAPPGTTQAIVVHPGGVLQGNTEGRHTDEVPFWIDELSAAALELASLDLSDTNVRVGQTQVQSTTLTVSSAARIVDFNATTPAETIKIEFIGPTTFNVTGSVTGPILENQTYVAGTPITAGNITITLTGAAAIGDEVNVEILNGTATVDQAIDKVNQLRSVLGSKIEELGRLGDVNSNALIEFYKSISDLVDLDFGAEVADLARNQVLSDVMIAFQAQANTLRQSILTLMEGNLSDVHTQARAVFNGE